MRRRSTMPADRKTRRCACSPARKAERNTASATISRWAARPCGAGSRTNSFARKRTTSAAASAGGDDDHVAFGLEVDLEPAGAGEEAGVERLDRVGVDGSALGDALEERRHGLRDTGTDAGRGDAEAHALPCPDRIHREHAAARDGLARDDQQVE